MATHQEIDQRSLAMHRLIAQKIDENPQLLEQARAWVASHSRPALARWEALLKAPWPDIRRALLDAGEEGCQLRQNSPFAGVLTPRERWQFYNKKTK